MSTEPPGRGPTDPMPPPTPGTGGPPPPPSPPPPGAGPAPGTPPPGPAGAEPPGPGPGNFRGPLLAVVAVVVIGGVLWFALSGDDDGNGSGGPGEQQAAEADGPSSLDGPRPQPEGAALNYAQAVNDGGCEAAIGLWSESFRAADTDEEAIAYCEQIDAGLPDYTSVVGVDSTSELREGEVVVALNLGGADEPAQVLVVEQDDGWWYGGPVTGGVGGGAGGPGPGDAGPDAPGDVGDQGQGQADDAPGAGADASNSEQECRNQPPHPDFADPEAQYQACLNGEI